MVGELYSVNISDSIEHHGIKGQRHGVRNAAWYPIAAYKEHLNKASKVKGFEAAESSVRNGMTNSYTAYNRKKSDISSIKIRGKLTDAEAKECEKIANRLFDRASKAEPKVTEDVISCARRTGTKMYGLENRIKQPSSIAAKIGSDAKEKGISFKEASAGIKDVLRYTTISEDKNFVKNYNVMKNSLKDKGYYEIKCKNYFDLYEKGEVMHKAVQSTFKNTEGIEFELQFQTPSSQAAKELKVPIYEERRQTGISKERASELEKQMKDLAESVANPKNIEYIKSHK